jgi:arylsulfatase A-like enzyme
MHTTPQTLVTSLALITLAGAQGQITTIGASSSSRQPLDEPPPRTNVVVVVVDDIGHSLIGSYANNYPCPGCAGAVAVPCTPNIDQLAADGVRFTNAWSSPLCTPTRAQILTGKKAVSLGIGRVTAPNNFRTGLDPDEVTLADLVPISAAIGKWHLSDAFHGYDHPLLCGFDDFLGTMWNLGRPPNDGPNFSDWRRYDGINPPVQQTGYATEVTTDDAIARLGVLKQEREPWLLYVAYHTAHTPLHCPPNKMGSVPCPTDWWGTCGGLCTYTGTATCQVSAMIQALDYQVGRLFDNVDWSDTAVIFLGDNGSFLHAQNPPFIGGGKGELVQGGINVPFIVRSPGGKRGAEVHELVQVSDIFATAAELAQVSVPASIENLDSVSFAPHLHPAYGPEVNREYAYAELFEPNFIPVAGQPPAGYFAQYHERAVRNDSFHLIERIWPAGTSYEFYQLVDPTPGAPAPPQDPSITPDPHQQLDLMLSQETWSPAVLAGFLDLTTALQTEYPPLSLN